MVTGCRNRCRWLPACVCGCCMYTSRVCAHAGRLLLTLPLRRAANRPACLLDSLPLVRPQPLHQEGVGVHFDPLLPCHVVLRRWCCRGCCCWCCRRWLGSCSSCGLNLARCVCCAGWCGSCCRSWSRCLLLCKPLQPVLLWIIQHQLTDNVAAACLWPGIHHQHSPLDGSQQVCCSS